MSSLFHGLLIAFRRLTVLNILFQPLPSLALRPQLLTQNESKGEMDLNVRQSKLVPEQEFPTALLQLGGHVVQVILHVLRQPDFRLLHAPALLVPARVQHCDSVQGQRALGCVHPLQDCVSSRVAERWEETVGCVVGVAEVSAVAQQCGLGFMGMLSFLLCDVSTFVVTYAMVD